MKKGISLPIEMIVVIAIAVLVLVVIAAFFVGGTGSLDTRVEQAFGGLCAMQMTSCGVDPSAIQVTNLYDLNKDNVPDAITTLAEVCGRKGISAIPDLTGANPCRRACGCPN